MQVQVDWSPSASRGVSGYQVEILVGGQSILVPTTGGATSAMVTIAKPNNGTALDVSASVATVTTYG
jgi:hypothetical protein